MLNDIIANLFITYANRIAESIQYTNWSDEFAREEVRSTTNNFLSALRKEVDFDHLSREDVINLGFRIWDTDDSSKELYLIPMYLLPIIPAGTEVVCITGERIIYDGKNMDNDNRFGYLAYGIEFDKE